MARIFPSQISITITHDSRLLLTLGSSYQDVLDLVELPVLDREGITSQLVTWMTQKFHESRPYSEFHTLLTHDYTNGFQIVVSGRSSAELSHFTRFPDALNNRFRAAFLNRQAPPSAADIRDFSDQLAQDIYYYFSTAKLLAKVRVADGEYGKILAGYLKLMKSKRDKSDQNYYELWARTMGVIMTNEAYLRLSDSPAVRAAYVAILKESRALYNWHMDQAKGGITRSR